MDSHNSRPVGTIAANRGFWSRYLQKRRLKRKAAQAEESVAPVATAATAITPNGFTAHWTGETGTFEVDVSLDANFATFVYQGYDVGNVTSSVFTGLIPGRTYYYRVRGNGGEPPNSNVISFQTTLPDELIFFPGWSDNGYGMDSDVTHGGEVYTGLYSSGGSGGFTISKIGNYWVLYSNALSGNRCRSLDLVNWEDVYGSGITIGTVTFSP